MLEQLLTQDSNEIAAAIQNLDTGVQRLIEARMKFLILEPGSSEGLVPIEVAWDVVPPAWKNHYHKGGHIIFLTVTAAQQWPPVPEAVWEAYEGGRIVMDVRRAESFPLNSRRVKQGRLEHAVFKGERGSPISVRQCAFEACHFIGCVFENVDFIDCDFLHSVFDACRFVNCATTDTHFAHTRWGDERWPDRINTADQCRQTGRVTFDGATGIGPALFMPDWAAELARDTAQSYNAGGRVEPPTWNHSQLRAAMAETQRRTTD